VDGTQTVTVTAAAAAHADGTDTIDVTDDDTAALALVIDAASMSENGGTAQGTVSRNTLTTSDLVVTLSSSDTGEATVPGSVTILAGQASATFPITAVDDAIVDGTQTVTVTAAAAAHADGTDTIDVTDDDVAALTVVIDAASMSENGGAAQGTVSRNTLTTSDLVVTLSSSDTGEATVPSTVTILAGQASATFPITAVDDAIVDGTQTVTVTGAATAHADGTDTIDVSDDDVDTITFVIDTASMSENGGAAQGMVSRNTLTTADLVVTLSSSDTSEATVAGTVTILAGQASATFPITAVDDAIVDGTQTVTVTGTATAYADGTDTIDVTDDDTVGINVSTISGDTTETGGTATFTVALDSEPTADVTIGISSTDSGEGTPDVSQVTITAANWDTGQTVTVTGVDDLLVDGDIAYTIVLAAAVSWDGLYDGIDPADVNATNLDNDVPIAYSYFPLSGTMVAGGTSYTAGLEPTAEPFDVAVLQATDGDAQSITEGESLVGSNKKPKKSSALDYYQWSFGVVADVTSFQLDAWRDANGESDDFLFEYSLNGSAWTALATVNSATSQSYDVDLSATPLNGSLVLRVVDTDRSPVKRQNTPTLESVHVDAVSFESLITDLRTRVNIMATDATAAESPLDNGEFTLSREGTTGDLDVFYTVNGSATAGTDYSALTGTATIPDGQTSATITVTPVDDFEAEGNETVIVILAEDDSYFYKVGASGSATVTITDDDLQTFVAASESTVSGSIVANDYTATADADGIVETLEEKRSGGKPANRTSYLDHRWTFAGVNGAESFYLTASRPDNADGDDFVFEYSTDGGSNWIELVIVDTSSLTLHPVALLSPISGTVLVRVVDTDPSTPGNSIRDTVNIDQMYFSSAPVAPLVVDGVAPISGDGQLTQAELEWASQRATDYWQQRAHQSAAVPIPSSITFEIVQIASPYLGLAYPEQNHIQIDIDAAGFGWNRVDVFSALIHEIGHLHGHDHNELGESLTPGVRSELAFPAFSLDTWHDDGHQATCIRPLEWLSMRNDAEIGDLELSSVLQPTPRVTSGDRIAMPPLRHRGETIDTTSVEDFFAGLADMQLDDDLLNLLAKSHRDV